MRAEGLRRLRVSMATRRAVVKATEKLAEFSIFHRPTRRRRLEWLLAQTLTEPYHEVRALTQSIHHNGTTTLPIPVPCLSPVTRPRDAAPPPSAAVNSPTIPMEDKTITKQYEQEALLAKDHANSPILNLHLYRLMKPRNGALKVVFLLKEAGFCNTKEITLKQSYGDKLLYVSYARQQ